MNEFLADLVTWIEQLSPIAIYAVVFGIAFAENLLPPVPGDLVIVFAGYLVGLDKLLFAPSIIVASLGGAVGFMAMFVIGRNLGGAILSPDRFRWVPKKRLRLALERVTVYGSVVVLVNRFLPGLRSVISLAAGMSSMRLSHSALASAVSAIVWSWLMVLAGKHLGENWSYFSVILKRYSLVFAGLLSVFVCVQLFRYVRSRRLDVE